VRKIFKFNFPILAILLIGLILRLISINQSFWLDEATSVWVARDFSLKDILTKFSPGDFHPPLYYLILKAWIALFGSGEVAVRTMPVLLGLLTVFLIFKIGNFLGRGAGVISAIFLATSGLHIYYSQEARMYILSAFFVALLIYLFLKLQEKSEFRTWIIFSFVLLLNSFSDYLPNLIILTFLIWGILQKKNKGWWKKFFAVPTLLLSVWIFWFPTFLTQLKIGLAVRQIIPSWWNILGQGNLKNIMLVPVKFILGRISIENDFVYAAISLTLTVFFAAVLSAGFLQFQGVKIRFKKVSSEKILLWLWLIVPLLAAFGITFAMPVFSYFRLLFALPPFYLLLAVGIKNINKKLLRTIFLIAVLFVNIASSAIYLLNPRFHREDWRGLAGFIQKNSDEKSIVLFVADSQTEGFRYYSEDVKIGGPESLNSGYEEVWLMRYVQDLFDPEDKIRTKVEEMGFRKSKEYNFRGVPVWLYQK